MWTNSREFDHEEKRLAHSLFNTVSVSTVTGKVYTDWCFWLLVVRFVYPPSCTARFNRTAGKMRDASGESLGWASCWKRCRNEEVCFPQRFPHRTLKPALDMWVHELQPKLLFAHPVRQRRETKGLCFPADVGGRRLARLQLSSIVELLNGAATIKKLRGRRLGWCSLMTSISIAEGFVSHLADITNHHILAIVYVFFCKYLVD